MMHDPQAAGQAGSTVYDLEEAGYAVLHGIGAGGGGQVYKAVQLSTGQTVAVKLLAVGELDAEVAARRVERFRREVAFCSALYHPDVVRVLDSGELTDGTRYAVFEFIPGKTLADVLREEGMLKVSRARNLMNQLLPPLAYAHQKGIAHRDLKPTNVMVISDGGRDRLKILDFGISISTRAPDDELIRLTQSHEWVGTPLYAAPEQLRGEPSGPKSDLYAWALMFLECLTGRTVVSGGSLAEVVSQHFKPTPHALPALLAQHRLGALLARVLEKNPERRLGDAQAVQSLLARISLDGLEDPNGYLREAGPSSDLRPIHGAANTVTDAELPEHSEQRRATLLCCRIDLIAAGDLASVEQIDALLDDGYTLVSEVLAQFGASGGNSIGGYALWFFGLSQTRDTDGLLAVRSALEIVNRIVKLPSWFASTGLELRIRIGLHNGPVTVQLSRDRREPVDGSSARIAQQLAAVEEESGESARARILVSEEFREVVARVADIEPYECCPELTLTGHASPLRVFRMTGESHSNSLRAERAPFVGRTSELDLLISAWRRAAAGNGSAVLISGEPGLGKSRLAAELFMRLEPEGCSALEMRCLPEWQNASLRPFSLLMRRWLGLDALTPTEAGARIERRVGDLGLNVRIAVPLICVWLSVPMPLGYVPLTWSPLKQRQLLHETLSDLLLEIMERGAALLVEDLHWADPSTIECLVSLLARCKGRSVLVVMTTRPGRDVSWNVAPAVIHLEGLDDSSASQLANALLSDEITGPFDVGDMIARADGIPLYVEELALALRQQEQAPVSAVGPARVVSALAANVPPSLRDLLSSRLDELGEGKETAQFASALGREFSLELLGALHQKDQFSLAGDLEELVSAQILVKRLRLGSPVYIFRHALIRDAAYDSMPEAVRQHAHERIAEGMVSRFSEALEHQRDVLAYHFERAGNHERAIHYWELAAKHSSFVSAHLEATSQIDRALALITELPDDQTRPVKEASLLLTRGAILVAKRGYTDPDARSCFERIVRLVPPKGETLPLGFSARWCLWYFHNTRANLVESSALADELRELAQTAADPVLSLSAWTAICESRVCTGKLAEAVAASRRCAEEYVFDQHRQLALNYGDDPHLASMSFEAIAELIRGRHDLALQRVEEGLQHATRLGFPALQAGMHGQAAWVYLNWGSSGCLNPNLNQARFHAGKAIALAHEHGFPFWDIYGRINDATARIAGGDPSAVPELRQFAELWCGAGANLGRCWHLSFIAQGLRLNGEFAKALEVFDEALAFCDTTGSRFFQPEVRRQRAELLGSEQNPARDGELAISECRRAANDARELGAHWWELASLVTAFRLEARPALSDVEELAAVVNALPSGASEPPLLREARSLLR